MYGVRSLAARHQPARSRALETRLPGFAESARNRSKPASTEGYTCESCPDAKRLDVSWRSAIVVVATSRSARSAVAKTEFVWLFVASRSGSGVVVESPILSVAVPFMCRLL